MARRRTRRNNALVQTAAPAAVADARSAWGLSARAVSRVRGATKAKGWRAKGRSLGAAWKAGATDMIDYQRGAATRGYALLAGGSVKKNSSRRRRTRRNAGDFVGTQLYEDKGSYLLVIDSRKLKNIKLPTGWVEQAQYAQSKTRAAADIEPTMAYRVGNKLLATLAEAKQAAGVKGTGSVVGGGAKLFVLAGKGRFEIAKRAGNSFVPTGKWFSTRASAEKFVADAERAAGGAVKDIEQVEAWIVLPGGRLFESREDAVKAAGGGSTAAAHGMRLFVTENAALANRTAELFGIYKIKRNAGRVVPKVSSAAQWKARMRKLKGPRAKAGRNLNKNPAKGRPRGSAYRGMVVKYCGGVYIVEAYREPFRSLSEAKHWIDQKVGGGRAAPPPAASKPGFLALLQNPRFPRRRTKRKSRR